MTTPRDDLFDWYLAYLRKNAQKTGIGNTSVTPMGLIHADRDLLKQIMEEEAEKEQAKSSVLGPSSNFGAVFASLVSPGPGLSAQTKSRLEKVGLSFDLSNHSAEALVCALLDTLELMQQKERLIFENCNFVLCELNADGRLKRLNESSEKILGFSSVTMLGAPLSMIHSFESKPLFEESLKKCRQTRECIQVELRVERNDNEIVDLLWRIEWSESASSYFCLAEDISERKKAERIKLEMTSMVTHDLRSPITGLSFTLQNVLLGSYGELPAKLNDSLGKSWCNLKSLLSLLDTMLDANKLEDGNIRATPQNFCIQQCFNHVEESLQEWCNSAQIQLTFEQSSLKVYADFEQCCRILTNICSNGIKWTPPGGKICVRATSQVEFVVVEVVDNGPGLSEDVQKTLFQRWSLVGQPVGSPVSSNGLGLYIARKFCELQGGVIGVQSSPGEGARFWFSLPSRRS